MTDKNLLCRDCLVVVAVLGPTALDWVRWLYGKSCTLSRKTLKAKIRSYIAVIDAEMYLRREE
jgi:hypothetical protein